MRRRTIGLAVVAMMVTAGVVSAIVTPANRNADVPEHLREGRWELTIHGQQVRRLVESECGTLPDGVWVDRPDEDALPVLLGAEPAQQSCFDDQVVPQLAPQ